MCVDHVPTQLPIMETMSAPYVAMAATLHADAPEIDFDTILYKIVTPYIPKAWHLALQQADLLHLFPNLVHDLIYGSPISHLPLLTHTSIPNNLSSANFDLA